MGYMRAILFIALLCFVFTTHSANQILRSQNKSEPMKSSESIEKIRQSFNSQEAADVLINGYFRNDGDRLKKINQELSSLPTDRRLHEAKRICREIGFEYLQRTNLHMSKAHTVDFEKYKERAYFIWGLFPGRSKNFLTGEFAQRSITDADKNVWLDAAFKGNYDKVVELLEKTTIDINTKDPWGYTALLFAALNSQWETAKLLIENQAQINDKMPSGNTAILLAAIDDQEDVVRRLIKLGADYDHKNQFGRSAAEYVLPRGLNRRST